jgi:hypothetical protein
MFAMGRAALACHSVRPLVLTPVPDTTDGALPVAFFWHLITGLIKGPGTIYEHSHCPQPSDTNLGSGGTS